MLPNDATVGYFIDPTSKIWKQDEIESIFPAEEGSIMKSNPLYHTMQSDMLIWPGSIDGQCFVISTVDGLGDT
nr:hypothetical protein CFP56_32801 [Quercus suber]